MHGLILFQTYFLGCEFGSLVATLIITTLGRGRLTEASLTASLDTLSDVSASHRGLFRTITNYRY